MNSASNLSSTTGLVVLTNGARSTTSSMVSFFGHDIHGHVNSTGEPVPTLMPF